VSGRLRGLFFPPFSQETGGFFPPFPFFNVVPVTSLADARALATFSLLFQFTRRRALSFFSPFFAAAARKARFELGGSPFRGGGGLKPGAAIFFRCRG